MYDKLIERAFAHVYNSIDVSGHPVGDLQRLDEFIRENAGDRRYRLFLHAASIGGKGIDTALVEYRRTRYYVSYDNVTHKFLAALAN